MPGELEQRNLAVVQALYAAAGSGDWARAEALLSDDFFIVEADTLPFAGVYRGRGALRELFAQVMGSTGVAGLDVQQFTAGGDRVVVLLDMLLAGPPQVRVPLAETFRLREGQVCEIRPYYFDPTPICAAVEARRQMAQR